MQWNKPWEVSGGPSQVPASDLTAHCVDITHLPEINSHLPIPTMLLSSCHEPTRCGCRDPARAAMPCAPGSPSLHEQLQHEKHLSEPFFHQQTHTHSQLEYRLVWLAPSIRGFLSQVPRCRPRARSTAQRPRTASVTTLTSGPPCAFKTA